MIQALLGEHTFKLLPAAYQYRLIQLLPECDRAQVYDGQLRFISFHRRALLTSAADVGFCLTRYFSVPFTRRSESARITELCFFGLKTVVIRLTNTSK